MTVQSVFRTDWDGGSPIVSDEVPTLGYSCFNTRNLHPDSKNVLIWLQFVDEATKNDMKAYMTFVKDLPDEEAPA